MVTQARAFTTRALIVKGAAIAFERYGYDGASLNDVVEAAGTTKGALYFHFKTKEALAREVIVEQERQSHAAVEAIEESGSAALEQIVMVCHEMARQILEDPIVRAGVRITLELSITDGPHHPYETWIAGCARLAARAIDEGDLREDVDAGALAHFIVSAFAGVQLFSQFETRRTDLSRRVDEMLQVLLTGLVPPRRRARLDKILAAHQAPQTQT
ncbi:ScbR family autoregulator-binding transcription factor [Tomitella fengzijianii]|uniref:TetR/AcrR family transcriptional regulator n=1 Tax=Tomitella fengzijianii TaxID=2597660 RepID=A0A516X2L5_9ACTN|nr:ScbR family autoregulator-binding transcription factor [Tomitella fengzijianii]QDQ96861.1 TetR/AcrR family transcriptional regulator [Tomitella fengzijianii]